ncbi:MAG: Ribonuclease BN, partial [Alphaproteobacteria bacterium MarineAlpha4_Bin2]
DVMLQGGSFANLSEFPVLQMFYRQGMMLPNHPGNTGRKPILIGNQEQVEAQLNYIYRGNYGLISEAEIEETGIDSDTAAEMMRMKLRFAFGGIKQTSELVDTLTVGREQEEIRDGVMVSRVDVNVFKISFRGESVKVDLNLPRHRQYESAYPLSYHQVEREYFSVIHSGEGDGWDINRPSMSSIICFQGKLFLVDAGPNLAAIMTALGISVSEIQGIFHTHSHDDHFAGLPTLMQTDHRIRYFATPLVRASVTKKLTAMLGVEEREFGQYFDVHDLDFDTWNKIGGMEVRPIFSPHPVETTCFYFRAMGPEGYKTYGHMADVASFEVLEGMVTNDDKSTGISEARLARTKYEYHVPATVKKIDIGGGLIHGAALDFKEDPSEKIILAHTYREHTQEEKEIGSGAPFGTVDVLIKGYQNYAWRFAYEYLKTYFSEASHDQLQLLLNNPVSNFNPESIIAREGESHEDVKLVLTGDVEWLSSEGQNSGTLSAGAFIGERSVLTEHPAPVTVRAASFVSALQIPARLYIDFVKNNGFFDEFMELGDKADFLRRTWLLGEAISQPVHYRIAKNLNNSFIGSGELFTSEVEGLVIVRSGKVEREVGSGQTIEIGVGDFFNEENVLFDTPMGFNARALENTEVCIIDAEVIGEVPVARRKLFETFLLRMQASQG